MGRKAYEVREIAKDCRYNSTEVTSLINKIMNDGKKSIAETIVYDAFDKLKKDGLDPLETFLEALKNARPFWEVRYRRVGGTTCAVPREAKNKKASFKALSWIVETARSRSEYKMADRLYLEILAASKKEGGAISAKQQLEKLAEANKAFIGLNW